ncbi:ABC transporter permease [Actinosynnema pretiosum subsp. pretiosum]|uniref:Binding-protein-dependent transport systems inner membrane component n=2 Tax=Actinosynnema TaxID=40566 RepID=C6WAP0_ACTMD|nr:ABC transporter permease [Actinosynnema mirum]ACU37359.1 binding-protein-dependent transport systems inner membrane component [Actinosynnema mirum DSM 43827]AXX30830.1 Oligopeptide transport system permease protein OppB [Actinosynnema pretiosum subsp. pretiosum]QUF05058.1 ABC transporter permease [Actinosynnema pretiosum subsp. pretiosum]
MSTRYLLGKLAGAATSLVLVVVLGFLLFRVIPGDPVVAMTRGRPVTRDQLAALRAELGVDRPVHEQFTAWVADALRGDLGTSYTFRRPVLELIGERLWPTVLLAGTATLLAVALGLWLGARGAWRHDSAFDRISTGAALAQWAMPTFWLGLLLSMVTGDLFPSGGMRYPDTPPDFPSQALDVAHHMVLPVLTMVSVVYAQYLLVMRSSLLEEKHADYITTARAKGLRDDLVRRRHAVPNALLPTVTLVFLHLGLVVSGAITVETVFSWPGLGLLTYEALTGPDLQLLQGVFVLLAGAVVLMNVLADLLHRVLDPRVRAS